MPGVPGGRGLWTRPCQRGEDDPGAVGLPPESQGNARVDPVGPGRVTGYQRLGQGPPGG